MNGKRNQTKHELRRMGSYLVKEVRINIVYVVTDLLGHEEEVRSVSPRYQDGQETQPDELVSKIFCFNEGRYEVKKLLDLRKTMMNYR